MYLNDNIGVFLSNFTRIGGIGHRGSSLFCACCRYCCALICCIFDVKCLERGPGNAKMREISQAVFEGAMAFLNRQYKTLIPFTVIIFAILWVVVSSKLAISFLVGAVCSAVAGYIGMTSTTKANARTCEAARVSLNKALGLAFRAGAVMGMSVAGLGLLGVSVLYIIFRDPVVINSFAFGASAIAFFARVGGGIFTKAADSRCRSCRQTGGRYS